MTTEATPSRDQALDALDALATVEHALLVEYLCVYCALGHDGGKAGPAAQVAFGLSLRAMKQLRRVNRVLVAAGRPAQVGRASGVRTPSGGELAFGPLSRTQLEHLVDREEALAAAVDARYELLRPAVAPRTAVFEDELLFDATFAVEVGLEHGSAVADLYTNLHGLTPAEYLHASRTEPANDLERALLAVADRHYAAVVETVAAAFAHDDALGGQLLQRAMSTMDLLNEILRLLVAQGLLPTFTRTGGAG
jgi:hypothetical protein